MKKHLYIHTRICCIDVCVPMVQISTYFDSCTTCTHCSRISPNCASQKIRW